jgi:hypothetical protein
MDWATSGGTVRIEVKCQDLCRELIRSLLSSDGGAAHSNFEISLTCQEYFTSLGNWWPTSKCSSFKTPISLFSYWFWVVPWFCKTQEQPEKQTGPDHLPPNPGGGYWFYRQFIGNIWGNHFYKLYFSVSFLSFCCDFQKPCCTRSKQHSESRQQVLAKTTARTFSGLKFERQAKVRPFRV